VDPGLNTKGEMLRGAGGMLAQMAPGAKLDPLGWIGQSFRYIADDDPFGKSWRSAKPSRSGANCSNAISDASQWALWVEVSSGLKLTAFLGGVRAFIEQTAPGMTEWESLEYRGQPYVKITPTERALPARPEGAEINDTCSTSHPASR